MILLYCYVAIAKWLLSDRRYQFEVSNVLGSVKGWRALIVHEGEGKDEVNLRQTFESNPVAHTRPELSCQWGLGFEIRLTLKI